MSSTQPRSGAESPEPLGSLADRSLAALIRAGIPRTSIAWEQSQGADGDTFAQVSIPRTAISAALHQMLSQKAAEKGAPIVSSALRLQQPDASLVRVEIEATAKAFMASVTIQVTGEISLSAPATFECRNLRLHSGTGIFAGIAESALRPKLQEWEGSQLDLAQESGLPLAIHRMEISDAAVLLQFRIAKAFPAA